MLVHLRSPLILSCAIACWLPSTGFALSSAAENAKISKSQLRTAFSSFSGKMTLSPEVIIPEPTDPTAILLQSTAVKTLSERLRTQAKANSAWLSGSTTSVQTFCVEQQDSKGQFPGPVPVIYCGTNTDDMEAMAGIGIEGILVQAKSGEVIASADELADDQELKAKYQAALDHRIQPIPEIVLSASTSELWVEEPSFVEEVVATLTAAFGDEPTSVLITVNPASEEEEEEVPLPKISRSLAKQVPILGSVRASAGENRIGEETARFKAAGFTGAVLRADCVPGFRRNPDLDFVGLFWGACIGDLKSTRSKSFNFQSRNLMNKSLPLEWAKYQKSVLDSGALGAPEEPGDLNTASGDYKGF